MTASIAQRIWKETTDMFKSEDGKTIAQLMKEESAKRTHESMKNSRILAAVYFWVVAFCTPWIFITQIVPNEFGDSSEQTRYWMKVLIVILSVQSMANWLCCRLTSTHVVGTRDRPVVDKTLWDGDESMRGDSTKDPGYCKICKLVAPYGSKTHHCKLCERCILRRDHHCYLLGTCVGYYNQRYFAVLMFYMGLSSWMCFVYFRRQLLRMATTREDFYWTDHILPWTVKHLFFGRVSWMEFVLLFFCYTFVWTGSMGVFIFGGQMSFVYAGLTYHEFKSSKKSRPNRTVFENFRQVFGPYWLTNFIMPMHWMFKQKEFERPVILSEEMNPEKYSVSHVLIDMDNGIRTREPLQF